MRRMRSVEWCFFCAVAVLGLSLLVGVSSAQDAAAATDGSAVVDITEANYDSLISTGDWMIEFYAPWCGHCKALAPKWEEFAKQTKGKLNVGKVDCTKHEELAALFEIEGFPTIYLVRNGEMWEYGGQRTAEAFTDFALGDGWKKKEARPAPASATQAVPDRVPDVSQVVVLTQSNFSEATAQGEWLLKFYAPWCGHCKNLAPKWEQLAVALKGQVGVAKIDCTQERLLCMLFDVTGYPTIKFLKDGQVRDYKLQRSVRQFIEFTRSGFLLAEAHPSPASSLWVKLLLFKVYEFVEPLATLMVEYVGLSFLGLGLLGLVTGFIVGRVTAGTRTRFVILSPEQWEQYKKAQAAKSGASSSSSSGSSGDNKASGKKDKSKKQDETQQQQQKKNKDSGKSSTPAASPSTDKKRDSKTNFPKNPPKGATTEVKKRELSQEE